MSAVKEFVAVLYFDVGDPESVCQIRLHCQGADHGDAITKLLQRYDEGNAADLIQVVICRKDPGVAPNLLTHRSRRT